MRRGKLRSTLWIWVMTLSILGSRSAVRVSAAETRPAVSCEKADFVLPSAGAHRLLALTEDTSSPDRTDGTGSPADRSDAASETPEGGPDKSAGGTDGEAGTDLTDPGEAGMEERDGSGTASDKESAGADDANKAPAGEDDANKAPAGEDGKEEGSDDGADRTDRANGGTDDEAGTDLTDPGEAGTEESGNSETEDAEESAEADAADKAPAGEDGKDEGSADGAGRADSGSDAGTGGTGNAQTVPDKTIPGKKSLKPAKAADADTKDDEITDEEIVTEKPDDSILPGSERLFAQYAQRTLYGEPVRLMRARTTAGSRLTGVSRYVYDQLRPKMKAIADGNLSSSVIVVEDIYSRLEKAEFTAEDLGIGSLTGSDGRLTNAARAAVRRMIGWDAAGTINALAADCPYDMYWFDKTIGIQHSLTLTLNTRKGTVSVPAASRITVYLPVEAEYASGYTAGSVNTNLNTARTGAASAAASMAAVIVEEAAGRTDEERLTYYRERICGLVRYDFSAASSPQIQYGDPWQLIYVFDGDPGTNVVCEGYAKAFQYLCELTDWQSDVSAISVTGQLLTGSGRSEKHMWNIVRIDGGRGLLADLTNCDGANAGAPDKLFMVRLKMQEDGQYFDEVTGLGYRYDDVTAGLFGEEDLDIHLHESTKDRCLCDVCGIRTGYRVHAAAQVPEGAQEAPTLKGDGIYSFDPDKTAEVSAKVSAACPSGLVFLGWFDAEGNKVSDETQYSFTLTDDVNLTARCSLVQDETDDREDGADDQTGSKDTSGKHSGEGGKSDGTDSQKTEPQQDEPEAEVIDTFTVKDQVPAADSSDKQIADDGAQGGEESQEESGGGEESRDEQAGRQAAKDLRDDPGDGTQDGNGTQDGTEVQAAKTHRTAVLTKQQEREKWERIPAAA